MKQAALYTALPKTDNNWTPPYQGAAYQLLATLAPAENPSAETTQSCQQDENRATDDHARHRGQQGR